MTWAEFKTNVRDHLHVHASRAGIQPLIDRKIKTGVIDIQRYIELYRTGQETTYEASDFTTEGEASVAALPAGAMPVQAEYRDTEEECDRHPLRDYPYGNVRDLICGNVPVWECRYWISFDHYGQSFTVFPLVEEGKRVILTWDGLKTNFADSDEVSFTEDVAEAVAEWVLITLAGEVDKNFQQRDEHKRNYAQLRKALYIDAQDRKRQRDSEPSPYPKGCTMSSCSSCRSLSSVVQDLCGDCWKTGPNEPEGLISGSPPDGYVRDDGTYYQLWIKRSGVNTKTGWVLAIQFAPVA